MHGSHLLDTDISVSGSITCDIVAWSYIEEDAVADSGYVEGERSAISLLPIDRAIPDAVKNPNINNMAANIAAFEGHLAPMATADSFGTDNWADLFGLISKLHPSTNIESEFGLCWFE